MTNFLNLRDDLELLLAGELGQYNLPDGSIELAIWVIPPFVPSNISIVAGSGIECLISKSPEQGIKGLTGKRKLNCQEWSIILRQHNFSDTVTRAVALIGEAYTGTRSIVRAQFEADGAIQPEQARIMIPAWNVLIKE